jgi:hypothetical protein
MSENRNPAAADDGGSEVDLPCGTIGTELAYSPTTNQQPRPARGSLAHAPKPRRHISAEVWATWAGALVRQWDSLPPDHPRVRPTLPVLRFLAADAEGNR